MMALDRRVSAQQKLRDPVTLKDGSRYHRHYPQLGIPLPKCGASGIARSFGQIQY